MKWNMKYINMIILAFSLVPFAQAQEGLQEESQGRSWSALRLSIGPSFRNFDDVDFGPVEFRNFNNATVAGGPFGVQGYINVPVNSGSPQTIDYITYNGNGNDVSNSSQWGPMLNAEWVIKDDADTVISAVFGFQFYSIQAGENDKDRNVTGFSLGHNVIAGVVQPARKTTEGSLQKNSINPTTSAFVENDFDMELYVLDLGVRASYMMYDPFLFSLAVGPTINIGDASSSQQVSATWTQIDKTDPGSFTGKHSQASKTDLVVGGYVALEGRYRLREGIDVALGFRYDIANKIGTSQATMDLDTVGGYAKIILDF